MLTVFNIYSIFSKLFKVPCEIHQHPDMKRYCSFFNVCTHQLFHHTSQHPQFHTNDNYIDITLLSCDQLFFNLSRTCLSMDSIKLQFKALKQSRVSEAFNCVIHRTRCPPGQCLGHLQFPGNGKRVYLRFDNNSMYLCLKIKSYLITFKIKTHSNELFGIENRWCCFSTVDQS